MVAWRRTVLAVAMAVFMAGDLGAPALAKAPSAPGRPIEEAVDLMYFAQGILLAEEEEADEARGQVTLRVSFSRAPQPAANPADQILARLITTTRDQIRANKAACQARDRTYRSEGKDCEVKLLKAACAADEARLNARLALLHKMRGDHRRQLTRVWASVRRSARSVWYRLGPKGRSFFRAFGKDVVQTAVTGGLHGGVVKTLFLNRLRSMPARQLRSAAGRAVERALMSRVRMARASGDPCDEGAAVEGPPFDQGAEDQACEDGNWLEAVLPEIEAQLATENKTCQSTAVEAYLVCLQGQAAGGVCPEEAESACAELYSAIPTDPMSASGAKGDTVYGWPVDEMTFSYTAGGAASGTIHVQRMGEIDRCEYTIDVALTGSFDYLTCSFQGTGTYSWQGKPTGGVKCTGLGEAGPLIDIPITWDAILEDGVVEGRVIKPDTSFGFQVPVGNGAGP